MQKIMRALGIKGIIPLTIMAITLITLSFSTLFIGHTAKSILLDVRADRIEDAAHSLSNNVLVQLQRAGKDMLIAASMPQVLHGLNLANPENISRGNTSRSGTITRPSLNALLNNLKLTFGYYDAFCLLDNKGKIIAGNPGKNTFLTSGKNKEWLRKALSQNTFLISEPISPSHEDDELLIPVSLKILYNGQTGIIVGTVQVSKIIKTVLHNSDQEGIRNLVIDNNGKVISAMENFSEFEAFKNAEWLNIIRDKVSGTIDININNYETTLGFYHVPQANMYAMTLADQHYMLSSARTIRNISLLSDIVCAFLTMLAIILYVFPIVRDINKLQIFAKKVSKGEKVQRAHINREDELGVLAKEMNNMVGTLTEMVGKAESSSKAKSEFLARMSPEIRTPMNGILGSAYLAMKENPGEPQLEHLKRIDNSAKDLLGIINDILDFSMLEAEEIDLSMQSFHLNGVLTTVSDILSKKAEEKGIVFNFSVDKNVPELLYSDALRLTQVCMNLCSNAIKFTEKGKVSLHVSKIDAPLFTETSANDYFPAMPENSFGIPYIMVENSLKKTAEVPQNAFFLAFTVSDTGQGIPKEKQETLFEAFRQEGESNTRKYNNTGLGLSISKSLVHALSGKIGYVSVPNKGSIFTFVLPLIAGNPQEIGGQLLHQENDAEIPKINILLAEDNEINQEIALEILSSMGIKPLLAVNGQEAFELWMEKEIDLILMDIEMPIVDGLQATKQIRESEKKNAKNVPIIAMTANAMTADKRKSKEVGMNDHLAKPLDISLLRKTLSYWGKKYLEEKDKS